MLLLLILLAQSQTAPCTTNTDTLCVNFEMKIEGFTRAFTKMDILVDPKSISDSAVCQGRLMKGSFRYYANGTAPSSVVGTLVPAINPDDPQDPSGTLENGDYILLYNKDLILGFKATQSNWAGAEMSWECKL